LSNVAVDVADAAGGLGRSGACSRAGRAGVAIGMVWLPGARGCDLERA
jgi:hypothetical protein